jgi:hydrogenase assembly chaperone HypC/HupF
MSECVADHGCITCGDAAIPMRVAQIDGDRGLALCRSAAGERESVEIALVEPVHAGEWLLVHAGTALARTDAEQLAAGDGQGAASCGARRPGAGRARGGALA